MSTFAVEGRSRPLRGRLRVPGDKSISHRALLLAARAEGTSEVRGLSGGDDVARTAAAVAALGARVEGERITGGASLLHEPERVLDLANSGTGVRLLAGFCAAFPWLTVLVGDESVSRRPMARVAEPLRAMGARVDGRDGGRLAPLVVRGGGLAAIDYAPPVASAQVKGAVLLAGLGADGETVVREAVATRAHTEELLARCGADVAVAEGADGGRTVVLRPSELEPFALDVPADPSQAAFWAVAASVVPGSDVTLERVYLGPGRAGFVDVLARMGADVELDWRDDQAADVRVRAAPLRATEVGGAEVPGLVDEVPALAVAAALAEGTTTFSDAAELRVKETDRIATVAAALSALGARVEPTADGLVVSGCGPGGRLSGGVAFSQGDHRVAMAAAVAGLVGAGPTRVEGWEAVATSYPGFEADLGRLLR